MNCKWSNPTEFVYMDPMYECTLDIWGHVTSVSKMINLISHSWHARILHCLAVTWTFSIDFVSCISWTAMSLEIKHPMDIIPKQVVLIIWLSVFALFRSKYFQPYLSLVECALGYIHVTKQLINQDNPFYKLIGSFAWIRPVEDNKYLPLRLLLEYPTIDLCNIYDHEYYTCGLKPFSRDVELLKYNPNG
ncbi:hypothetical protein THRCLA_07658 [Thraustotheca clavata]|uniref:Transmembrane protein n=1 Tax=Thraustotheca clavata TaxID=74557 RepID=A0A1V9ZCL2_9STRA|nr:hypothetical protein THRCLA_07658 [Thraustotheca clavata]